MRERLARLGCPRHGSAGAVLQVQGGRTVVRLRERASVGSSSPAPRLTGADFGFTPMSELRRLHVLVDPLENLGQRAAQAVALRLEVPGHALDVRRQLGPGGLQPGDLVAQLLVRLGLQLRGRRLRGRNGGARRLLGLRDDRGRLGLALPLGLVDELLGQQQRALQRLVGERRRRSEDAPAWSLSAATGAARFSRSSWAMRSLAWRSRSFSCRTCSCSPSASWAALSRYSSTSSTL